MEPLIESIIDKKGEFEEESVKTLNNVFHLIKNWNYFYESDFAKNLFDQIQGNWKDAEKNILFGKLSVDPLMQNSMTQMRIFQLFLDDV